MRDDKRVIRKVCLDIMFKEFDCCHFVTDYGILKEDVISMTVWDGKLYLFYWSEK